MDIATFIKPELLILIPVLYIAGIGIKKSNVRDSLIPACLGVIGVVLSLLYVVGTSVIADIQTGALCVFTAVTQGVLAAGASVYGNQIVIQYNKKD